jgi:RNA polymerase-binding transcription factor DksA
MLIKESALEPAEAASSLGWREIEERLRNERRRVIVALTLKSISADRWAEGCLIQDSAYDEKLNEDELGRRVSLYRRLRRLDDALRRLSYGIYGFCSECGEQIATNRLLIDPAASLCLTCKSASDNSCNSPAL